MPNQNISSHHFQKKISKFCDERVGPVASKRTLENIKPYLISFIICRKSPPLLNGRIDWAAVEDACGVRDKLTVDLKKQVSFAFDAVRRWLGETPIVEDGAGSRRSTRSNSPGAIASTLTKSSTRKPRRVGDDHRGTGSGSKRTGPQPKEIQPFPEPLFEATDDPVSFQDALVYHMRRFGESYWQLYRAVVQLDETFDHKTLLSWIQGDRVPRSVASFRILSRIEKRYRLSDGYLKSKLPHQSRSLHGHDLGDISPAERRRIALHLPDDFDRLPFSKREEIIDWVRRVIISGSTDYRRYQAAAIRQRYAIRFPGITYGGMAPSQQLHSQFADANKNAAEPCEDPDLLTGVVDAPPRLAMEMADLIRFKTSTLTKIGYQRNGVWGEETAAQKIEHLGLMFGALAASPDGPVKGRGVPLGQLTFGLLIFPGVWDWYLQWREQRRGFYTKWEEDMLMVAQALTRAEVGWIRQHPDLLRNVRPIEGLVAPDEIELATRDWHSACDAFHRHAANRSKEIQRVMRVHRDPFEPIMVILEADSPLSEYRKITDEILKRMPDEHRYPRAAAEAVRSFLLLRIGLHLGLRQKNLRQLRVCPRGHFPTSERRLEDMRCGELRWSDRDGGWEVLIPSVAFKNSGSSFFGQKPFRLVLPDLLDLYEYLEAYINRHRGVLLGPAKDPGTLFVKTVKKTSLNAAYDSTTFYEAWRTVIQRYGIYNPYTGRGAIKGLLPHGPHNLRDILATHILKQTGSYEQASYAIQDTPDVVQQHYGRFLPQDKAALAARILNQVWEAA
ncbi:hypothetical protein FE840_018450 (plasmid) [Peteryoungia desertarenae]|uniref:Uncharacterized protein n=1 Tax=Peteryoungia desertarenae TaxID=1813451 RepID=A0ABX6QSN9_9HYPH|nr:hypothetical protein [Peteryoungia desertarenae]QLF71633.1 hypothetical protein FE840_018450 [Peteryoungia desertarenae]